MNSQFSPTWGLSPGPAPSAPSTAQLARGITVTWWYTVGAVLFFEIMSLPVWVAPLFASDIGVQAGLTIGIGSLAWVASTVPLLVDYRHRADATPGVPWLRLLAPILIAVTFGIVTGTLTGSWLLALGPLAQSLILLNWQSGVRLRVVLLVTVVLACMWVIDARMTFTADGILGDDTKWWLPALYTASLPALTVLSLWWWDVLITLDRARVSEARLAATQERLRVATDVHDLQGHHLQVIALQLELAERLASSDPGAALEQLRAARKSVGEAQQGTRDLALRFRAVPLRDELANAGDLLSAAGIKVETVIDTDADHAPASDLGPVIRETTTNVLRHGGGTRARLALTRTNDVWCYEITNDIEPDSGSSPEGSGLEGIKRRISEAGGTFETRSDTSDFTVIVTVPALREAVR